MNTELEKLDKHISTLYKAEGVVAVQSFIERLTFTKALAYEDYIMCLKLHMEKGKEN